MFGFSISKILFTAGIIIVVWRGFKMLENFRARVEASADEPPKTSPAANPDEVEMVACPRCGTYLPKGQFCTCS